MKANMVHSNVEWIGDIPIDWDICRLKYLSKYQTGFTPDTARADYYDTDGVPWVTIADMDSKYVSESKLCPSKLYLQRFRPAIVKQGSLLFSFKLSAGKAAFAGRDLYTNEAIAAFQEGFGLALDYLYYASSLIQENAGENIYGAKIMNQRSIGDAPMPTPPIAEQHIIADYLDKACEAIDSISSLMEEQIGILINHRHSLIFEAVTKGLDPDAPMKDSGFNWVGEIPETWIARKLKHVVKRFSAGTSVRAATYPASNEEIGVLSLSAVLDGVFHPEENKLVDIDELPRVSCAVEENTLLISRCNTSELVGVPAFVDTSYPNLYLPDKLWKADFGSPALNRFLWYTLQAKPARAYCEMMSVGSSSSMQNISSTDFLNMWVVLPRNDHEIDDIVHYLDEKCSLVDEIIATKRNQLETLRQYRQSIIYEYVTGKRRVGQE